LHQLHEIGTEIRFRTVVASVDQTHVSGAIDDRQAGESLQAKGALGAPVRIERDWHRKVTPLCKRAHPLGSITAGVCPNEDELQVAIRLQVRAKMFQLRKLGNTGGTPRREISDY
jgi:hypothetical protein